MNTNTQRSSTPLYKLLSEKINQQEWDYEESEKEYCITSSDGEGMEDFICIFKKEYPNQEANAQYTALAVNNLNQLAEFAEWVVKEIETTPDELTDALLGLIKLKANEALNKIS